MKKVVTFTICQRPFYLRPTLESWSAVRGKQDWAWCFAVEPTSQLDAQLTIIQEFVQAHELDASIVLNPTRLGVLLNPWAALERSFAAGADFVVLAEEDLIVATDVLEYLGWAAEALGFDPAYGAINARGYGEDPTGDPGLVSRSAWFPFLVWGTWSDRWEGYLRDTWDKDYSSGGSQDSGWDWNLSKRVFPAQHAGVLSPLVSRSDHIGKWGGAHMRPEEFEASEVASFCSEIEPGDYHF